MTKRHPNITIHRHSLSIVQEPERLRMARRGELVHQAIRFLCDEAGTRPSHGQTTRPQADHGPDHDTDHGTFRGIGTKEIEQAVRRALALLGEDPGQWKIDSDFVRPLGKALALPRARAWFEPGLRTLREAEIVDAKGDVHRPDLVVIPKQAAAGKPIEIIDFKVGKREEGHSEQVKAYGDLLRAVYEGAEVKGFLLYIDEPAIIEVA